jgi:hypothetical protein
MACTGQATAGGSTPVKIKIVIFLNIQFTRFKNTLDSTSDFAFLLMLFTAREPGIPGKFPEHYHLSAFLSPNPSSRSWSGFLLVIVLSVNRKTENQSLSHTTQALPE